MRNRFRKKKVRGNRASHSATDEVQLQREKFELQPDEKMLIQIIPASINGVRIGDALRFDDGSVEIRLDDDAPEESVLELKAALADLNRENNANYTLNDFGVTDNGSTEQE